MSELPSRITVDYDSVRLAGRLECQSQDADSPIWTRLKGRAVASESDALRSPTLIELPWSEVLTIIRELGTKQAQQDLKFRFQPTEIANKRIAEFVDEVRRARQQRDTLTKRLAAPAILSALGRMGFKRELKPFQLRDVEHLLALSHGANFSVPGAGKTTVTLALHLLTRAKGQHLLVVGPKAAFPAWRSIVEECMSPDAPDGGAEPFTVLDGSASENDQLLRSGRTRFVISYDLLKQQTALFTAYFARQPVHLVLDEAHRIKAGGGSQRGAVLLGVSTLPVRRDILTGTPMPQGSEDIASLLAFLWPGHGLDSRVLRGENPRDVLGQRYVRTTKQELGLTPAKRHFYQEGMSRGQLALYGIVRSESLRQLTRAISSKSIDFMGARKSVMRLLQLSSNPVLALKAMNSDVPGLSSGIADQVLADGASPKMAAVVEHARRLAQSGEKCVIWTIFTESIGDIERMLADLNPVVINGLVPSGDVKDPGTREGRLYRFHRDAACKVMIANPAAAGEGISLHKVCHNAIYLDRSYVSTHYLQSVDRIHRLGLDEGVETNIHIYQTKAPVGLGSIDLSVSRRLAMKLRNLQLLLNDPDLHQIALDEENADDPVDYDVEMQDLVDLVEELEGRASSEQLDEP